MLLKVFWRLVRFFKFLLSFSPRFPRCNAALGRFVSLWRQVWRHKTPFFGLGSPPHILCSHDPAQPLLTNDQPAQELSTMNPPQPSDDHRGQLPTSNPHVVIQVSERNSLGPSGTLGTPAPICSSASSRVTTGSAEGESARSEPAWQVKPGVANGDTRYAPRTKDRYVHRKGFIRHSRYIPASVPTFQFPLEKIALCMPLASPPTPSPHFPGV